MTRILASFYRSLREPFSAASHLSGAFAGLCGSVYLLSSYDQGVASPFPLVIYTAALVALFLVSGLLHGIHSSPATLARLERLDYAAIYLFIAGSYTPICLFVIQGPFGIGMLTFEWGLALVGAWLALTRGPAGRTLQVVIYLLMGWAFLLALPSLSASLTPLPFNLLVIGGVVYSLGAIIFALERPAVVLSRFSSHDVWHLFVLFGSSSHFIAIAHVVT